MRREEESKARRVDCGHAPDTCFQHLTVGGGLVESGIQTCDMRSRILGSGDLDTGAEGRATLESACIGSLQAICAVYLYDLCNFYDLCMESIRIYDIIWSSSLFSLFSRSQS